MVFAPEATKVLANWLGAIMFVSAAGIAGYKRVWFKSEIPKIELEMNPDIGKNSNGKR